MQKGFWVKLNKPIMALAPMANVTDAAFRFIIAKYGKPDVLWTEFVSCDGLVSSGRTRLLPDLWFSDIERPIVAQFFGAKPEHFYKCAQLAQELGFDGIDINMGCPDKTIEKQGAGAALIKNPALAKKIILETKRGAGHLPVSIKTRIGFYNNILDEWLPHLLEMEPAAITIHARTRKEMSKVPAHWEAIQQAVTITKKYFSGTGRPFILGNGDVESVAEARTKSIDTGADGIMIGRGIFGNPWLFNNSRAPGSITLEERLRVLIEHTHLFEKKFKSLKSFEIMKKHYKAYVAGFDSAKELRLVLMTAKTATEVEQIIKSYFPNLNDTILAALTNG